MKLSKGFLEALGRTRIIDTPIAESAIVGHAIGMAYMGLRPIVEMQFIDFIACAFNMVTNFAARSRYRQGQLVGDPRTVGRRSARRPISCQTSSPTS